MRFKGHERENSVRLQMSRECVKFGGGMVTRKVAGGSEKVSSLSLGDSGCTPGDTSPACDECRSLDLGLLKEVYCKLNKEVSLGRGCSDPRKDGTNPNLLGFSVQEGSSKGYDSRSGVVSNFFWWHEVRLRQRFPISFGSLFSAPRGESAIC